ncbi:TetR family transcriptional regulator [Actinoplanes palleronii]|uniref:TetR family transcriptional regulator n=1 Tax=Actinoplanes palleronii TaxID=113570 RepID=A0ABQ4BQ38_9ACTN|nr:TetR family transcriptional regulator [Actinoplanes palleronii]GIE72784.1 TetR family transcriptional regulator [Actinoplanes palleronii]
MAATISTDSTGDRIVAAATTEFAQHGVAGARIERIAKTARTSKERVYAYFRSKEALYQHVLSRELATVAEATRLDPRDLAGYAGRIHDYFMRYPERLRLMTWGRMRQCLPGEVALDDPIQRSVGYKIELIREAQRAGHLDPSWEPLDILVFVNQIAMSWADQPDLVPADVDRAAFLAARRAAVVTAVERLFPSSAQGPISSR